MASRINIDDSLRAIVAKASSMQERLSPDYVAVNESDAARTAETRLEKWRSNVADGDRDAFRLRLSWDGLDETQALRMLQPVRLRPEAALPGWASTLREVLQVETNGRRERCLDEQSPIPFEDLLIHFVTWARTSCESKAGSAYSRFSAAAHTALERQLLDTLAVPATSPLYLEFRLALNEEGGVLDQFSPSEPSRAPYDAFVRSMLDGQLVSFFEEYSVLARVLTTITELWVEAIVEMIERFQNDATAIATMLGLEGQLHVTDVAPLLSDPHRGRRSVAILTFSSGDRIVYKPRNVGIEAKWNEFLHWLRVIGSPVDFRTYRVIDRGDYGWAECVQYAACKNDNEARQYFIRAGALLCVVHLLYGIDCHADNLISAGEYPVLIDVETVLTPQTREAKTTDAEAPRIAQQRLTKSTLATYLLPFWSRNLEGNIVYDGSGLGVDPADEAAYALSFNRWDFINTDQMKVVSGRVESAHPRAAAEATPLRIYEFETQCVGGFEAMYRFLIRERETLLAADSLFQRLSDAQVRFVYRNTSIYSAILERLQMSELLRDGRERSIEIERLAVAALTGMKSDSHSGWVDIWNAERVEIERGDVPYFSLPATATGFSVPSGKEVAEWFVHSGHAAAIARLRAFDEVDLAFQVDIIRLAVRSRAPEARIATHVAEAFDVVDNVGSPGSQNGSWLTEATAIAALLERDAIHGSDGSISWLQPGWSKELTLTNPKPGLNVTGNDLYEGALGIALFLAALARVTGDSHFRALAEGAVYPLRLQLESKSQQISGMGIGGLIGLGSVVYGLVRMSSLLNDPRLLKAAEQAVTLITPERIDSDVALDITSGSAGALLGLLAFHETTASPQALAGAIRCGKRLLARMEPAGQNINSIRTVNGRFLNGFSHGAAGFAYALGRLYAVTGDSRFLAATRAFMEFERTAFSIEHSDWPDLREPGPLRFMSAWCHGAPGIALGRIANLGIIDDETTRSEIERALEITQREDGGRSDHLCCGTFGLVEILSTAGRILGRSELRQHAEQLAMASVSRSRARQGYTFILPTAGRLQCRGLFQGLAGIALTLLRLQVPDSLPEALLLR